MASLTSNKVTLYKNANGKTRLWSVWTSEGDLITEYGENCGKLIQTKKMCTPKNVGKSNETTAAQQAVLQQQSAIKKKVEQELWQRSLTSTTVSDGDGVPPPMFMSFRPMLADSFDKQRTPPKFEDTLSQVKLDGVRLNCYLSDCEVVFKSRNGKDNNNVSYLADSVKTLLDGNEDLVIDGELYRHKVEGGFQSIVGSAKKENDMKLEYFVYDIFDASNEGASFMDRFVKRFDGVSVVGEFIKIVPVSHVQSREDLMKQHATAVEEQFEGLMLRNKLSKYAVNKRSKDLLKVKLFQDAEFPIIGFHSGEGRDENSVIFECALENCKTFRVRPAWTLAKRQEVYNECVKDFTHYNKKRATVTFFERTTDGSLRFPILKCVRDYE